MRIEVRLYATLRRYAMYAAEEFLPLVFLRERHCG